MTLTSMITTVATGATLTMGTLTGYQQAAAYVAPILQSAVDHQEATVSTAESMGLPCAIPARAQWEDADHKPKAELGIAELKAFAGATTIPTTSDDDTNTINSLMN